jgi:hypothetical protein
MTAPTEEIGRLSEAFRRFAVNECRAYCRFYEDITERVADEPDVLALVETRLPGQPAPNILMAAVRFLLAGGVEHPLARGYARADEQGRDAEGASAWPAFRDFCLERGEAIRRIAATHRVQTNEVGRSAALRVGAAHALREVLDRPVALVDVGTSAGLNLFLDRVRVRYRRDGAAPLEVGPPHAPVVLECALRGARTPTVELPRRVEARVGLDLHPVDVRDPLALRWLEALMWPGQAERVRRLRAAVAMVRREPPDLREGDAAELLPDVLERLPARTTACVLHSAAWQQMGPETHARIRAALAQAARSRPVAEVGLVSEGNPFELVVTRPGEGEPTRVGRAHAHGEWLEWLAY